MHAISEIHQYVIDFIQPDQPRESSIFEVTNDIKRKEEVYSKGNSMDPISRLDACQPVKSNINFQLGRSRFIGFFPFFSAHPGVASNPPDFAEVV